MCAIYFDSASQCKSTKMNDFVIDDAAIHFEASKNSDYRDHVVQRFTTFIEFLQKNGLTQRIILQPGQKPSSDLKIMKSDLTDEGFAVVKESYDRWLRGIENGKPIHDISVLENALASITKPE